MCGITGYLSPHPDSLDAFVAIRDRVTHRGPDDAGVWLSSDGTVRLGHRRLAILDLTPSGHQPMVSPCGRYVIVFNGEIYNYLELRDELQGAGYRFEGSSDTEVILAAFLNWRDACLQRFNGMFALAIWDNGSADTPASLFLARDRAGKKPLYFAHQAKTLAFASELKAIPPSLRGSIDLQALNHYLALGYVPSALCIAAGVRKLPPAHAARFHPDRGEMKVWRWWQLPVHGPAPESDVGALVEEAEALLRRSVSLRMRSDVPVGVLLSGGLDSSLVTACAAQSVAHPVKTFTMGLPGSKLDETPHANIVAQHFSTNHHILELTTPSLDVLDELAHLIDEPIADSSLIPAYMVSKLTAHHVKVALGGDGGDELFGGYTDYTTAIVDNGHFGWIPKALFRMSAALAEHLPTGVRGRNRISALRGGPYESLIWGSPYFDAVARRRILSPEVVATLGADFMAPEHYLLSLFQAGKDPVDAMTRTHFGSILPDDFLVKVDRASMAVSLEMRAPFLDKHLVEFAFGRIPSEWKVLGKQGRRLEKLLAQKLLPSNLDIDRKQGFSIPLDTWLRNGKSTQFDDLYHNLGSLINESELKGLIAGLNSGRANGSRLFALMMLSISANNIFQ